MQKNKILVVEDSGVSQKPPQVASWAHLVGFLLIGAGVVALGFLAQQAPSRGGPEASGQFASHGQAIPIYLTAIVMDWALLYYCWVGVHRRGGNVGTLSGALELMEERRGGLGNYVAILGAMGGHGVWRCATAGTG